MIPIHLPTTAGVCVAQIPLEWGQEPAEGQRDWDVGMGGVEGSPVVPTVLSYRAFRRLGPEWPHLAWAQASPLTPGLCPGTAAHAALS